MSRLARILIVALSAGAAMLVLGRDERKPGPVLRQRRRRARHPAPQPEYRPVGSPLRLRLLPMLLLATAVLLLAGGYVAYMQDRARDERAWAISLTGGDPDRAPQLMTANGCAGCHVIPGVPGATGRVGPPLTGIAQRVYIGGTVSNTPDHLIRWIRNARSLDPHTGMPTTGVSERDARDIAAYLYAAP